MTETKPAEEQKRERRLEKEIEVAAPIEDVWKAPSKASKCRLGCPHLR
jgi:uncharacterized protein YndB with AHSA1/START domain